MNLHPVTVAAQQIQATRDLQTRSGRQLVPRFSQSMARLTPSEFRTDLVEGFGPQAHALLASRLHQLARLARIDPREVEHLHG